MPRKITLNINGSSEYLMIGISSHLKDYRISFFLNRTLGFKFRKIEDFSFHPQGKEPLTYPVFVFNDHETRALFCLLSNHHPERKLFPDLKQTDYFMFTNDPINEKSIEELIRNIRSVPNILAAFKIDTTNIKNMDIVAADLELHLLQHK